MKILVVEDDQRLRNVLVRALSESGHAVDSTADGIEGETLGADPSYDAVVLDAMLPGQDGLVVVRSLRRRGVRTPIIFLTARDTAEDAVAGLDAGADDYMRKPFALSELEARLRTIRQRDSGLRNAQLCAGDVTFDTSKRRVWRGEHELDLTAREVSLLEYLMRNAGRVVTRQMITDAVWGFDADVASNVIDVYVGRLRTKLEPLGSRRLLHTVRGLGYRFGD
jgi:two-component system OmpR family response regulator